VTEARTLVADILHGAARSDPGRARSNNEDLPLLDAARGIYGVIDGVGGQAGGEVAAAIARDVILQRLARPVGSAADRVREAIAIANNEIFRRAQESPELRGMACVVTLALVVDGRLVIGHVGDTRFYKLHTGGLRKLTRDHSPVGEREDAGELNEVDAMRHPRRNEVFRDVGSVFRDKDEQDFVDIIEEPLERDEAILICSDGLSDMLPSPTIAHIARQHAGDPSRVTEALVAAANDAGGKDNITVVYAEGPYFASALRGEWFDTLTPTEPLNGAAKRGQETEPRPGWMRRTTRAVVRSRTSWFFAGTLLGVLGAVGLMFYVARTQVRAPQTHVVAADGSTPYLRIAEAMAAAQPGVVVRIEPGEYMEQVVVADGVDLVARIPGSVTISRPLDLDPAAAGLTAGGSQPARISGVRITAAMPGPGSTAISVAGAGARLDLVEITGPHARAVSLSPGASLTMQGSRVGLNGTLVSVPEGSHANFANNIFYRAAPSPEPPIVVAPSSGLTLKGNVFSGFAPEIVRGLTPARRQEVLEGNTIVPPPPAPRRQAGRRG
jgi:serine/threonine protein phosphatase PrpC